MNKLKEINKKMDTLMKAIMELMDFHDSEKYLKSPQQVQQEQT